MALGTAAGSGHTWTVADANTVRRLKDILRQY